MTIDLWWSKTGVWTRHGVRPLCLRAARGGEVVFVENNDGNLPKGDKVPDYNTAVARSNKGLQWNAVGAS